MASRLRARSRLRVDKQSPRERPTGELARIADRCQPLHRDEPIIDSVGRFDNPLRIRSHPREVSAQALDPGDLAGGQQRLSLSICEHEQVVRLLTGFLRRL